MSFFRKLFGGKSPFGNDPVEKKKHRDLFQELFPLTETNQKVIESKLKQFAGEIQRKFEDKEVHIEGLIFNSLGWKSEQNPQLESEFLSEFGDAFMLQISEPNGTMVKGKDETEVYRSWIRNLGVQNGGGLIFCEPFENKFGTIGKETILKIPPLEGSGMNYVYFLNISNFEKQLLYQITIKVFEGSPTGLRDNLMMHPLCEIFGIDMSQIFDLYRQDPYDKTFSAGNVMNLSEREEFDYLFPNHPLSVIRQEIRPRILETIRFEK